MITLEKNSGQAAAINSALKVYSGEYMMWMDSDDICMPRAIEKKVDYLENNPDKDYVLNQGYIVNEDDVNRPIGKLQRVEPKDKDDLFSDLIYEKNIVFCPGTIFVKSSSLKKAIPTSHIYESREGQNWQLMLPLAYCCKWGYINEPLFKYVVHSDSHSHSKKTYERQIERLDNFYALLNNTIRGIPGITDKEANDWEEKIEVKTLLNKLSVSRYYKRKADYCKIRQELKDKNIRLEFRQSYYPYRVYSFIRTAAKPLLKPVLNLIRK